MVNPSGTQTAPAALAALVCNSMSKFGRPSTWGITRIRIDTVHIPVRAYTLFFVGFNECM